MKTTLLTFVAVVAACPMASFAQSAMPGMSMPPGMTMPMAAGQKTPADQAYMQSMTTMGAAMAAPMSGDPDRDFAAMMIPHHEGAIAMARIELRYGKDATLRKLAEDVIAAQDKEIAVMKAWTAHNAK